MFINKLRDIAGYIDKKLECLEISDRDRFVLLRDQAYFKLQFFSGNRTSDLNNLLSQEIKDLPSKEGLYLPNVGKDKLPK